MSEPKKNNLPSKLAALPEVGKKSQQPLLLKKAVETINKKIVGTQSFGAKKLSNALVYIAYDNLLTEDMHYVSVSDLKKLLNYSSNDTELIKEWSRELTKTQIEFSYFDHKNKEKWGISNLVSEVHIERGVVKFSFPTGLRALMYNPAIYAKIDLQYQRQFKSANTLHLFEFCTRYKEIGTSGYWPVDHLKTIFNIDQHQSLYKEYKFFNIKVLKPSIDEINALTDIEVSMQRHMQNRKVGGITFIIKKKKNIAHPAVAEPIIATGKEESLKLRLQAMGFKPLEIDAMMEGYDQSYLTENLSIVEKAVAAGKVKSATGYLMQALKIDYRPVKIIPQIANPAIRQPQLFEEEKNKALDIADRAKYEKEQLLITKAYSNLSTGEQEGIYQQFLGSVPKMAILARKDAKSPVVENMFSVYLKGTWWPSFATIKRTNHN